MPELRRTGYQIGGIRINVTSGNIVLDAGQGTITAKANTIAASHGIFESKNIKDLG